jgi:hypothetical protein
MDTLGREEIRARSGRLHQGGRKRRRKGDPPVFIILTIPLVKTAATTPDCNAEWGRPSRVEINQTVLRAGLKNSCYIKVVPDKVS